MRTARKPCSEQEETTHIGDKGGTPLASGRQPRAAAKSSLNALDMHNNPSDKRWVPYDPSELVISTSERPSQRYPLVYQDCVGRDGLDYALLHKSAVRCSETLIKDMYSMIDVLFKRVETLTKELQHKVHDNDELQKRLGRFLDYHESLLSGLEIVCRMKFKAEEFAADFGVASPRHRGLQDEAGTWHEPMDALLQAAHIGDEPVLDTEERISEDDLNGIRVQVLGKGTVRVQVSSSGFAEKPLHALHILPVDSSSNIDQGLYYFQKQFLDIINAVLPKRFKVSSLGAWNYTIRNIKTEVLQGATWNASAEAREAKEIAKGPKGVILLTHNTLQDVIDNLVERTQDDKKWGNIPGRVQKQNELKQKTDDLVKELETILQRFHGLMMSERDALED